MTDRERTREAYRVLVVDDIPEVLRRWVGQDQIG